LILTVDLLVLVLAIFDGTDVQSRPVRENKTILGLQVTSSQMTQSHSYTNHTLCTVSRAYLGRDFSELFFQTTTQI